MAKRKFPKRNKIKRLLIALFLVILSSSILFFAANYDDIDVGELKRLVISSSDSVTNRPRRRPVAFDRLPDSFKERKQTRSPPGTRATTAIGKIDLWGMKSTVDDAGGFVGDEGEDDDASVAMNLLLQQMGNDWHFWWIKKRIRLLWPEFLEARKKLNSSRCQRQRHGDGTRRLQLMILPGLLTLSNFAKPEIIRNGGPLGELTQWADLIAACHALCHDVVVRSQIPSTIAQLRADIHDDTKESKESIGCGGSLDLIYTDIMGFRSLPKDVIDACRFRFRILDAFGTEAMYNDPEYAKSHGTDINHWGMLDLKLKQFYSLYPHTPDNSFLGFVLPSSKISTNITKDNYAVIMGKEIEYLVGKMNYLSTIHEIFPLRATLPFRASQSGLVPEGTQLEGILDSETYRDMLEKAKVCVGLGDPVESPGVLEAIARGCVFLNPRRKADRTRLIGKATSRRVTSQIPYLEEYLGPPFVYTVDTDDVEELRNVLRLISQTENHSFLPFEFSIDGFLQRLDAYQSHQNYCRYAEKNDSDLNSNSQIWPPVSSLQVVVAPFKTSCKKACRDKGLVCEPDHFFLLNSTKYIESETGLTCRNVRYEAEIYPPTYFPSSGTCSLQTRSQLFSCAAGELDDATRICPCRDFRRFQVALCKCC